MKNQGKRCPRCHFMIIDDYCPKCGYYFDQTYLEKYKEEKSGLEVFMGDGYRKVIGNENLGLLFFLGPLYFSIYRFYFLGFFLFSLEFLLCYLFHQVLFFLELGMYPIILFYFCSRFFFLLIGNCLLLRLIKLRLSRMEKNQDNRRFIIGQGDVSFYSVFITLIFVITFFVFFLFWYRNFR